MHVSGMDYLLDNTSFTIEVAFGPNREYTALYRGGPYIDLYRTSFGRHGWDAAVPFTTINVWDYQISKPTIPATPRAVLRQANDWLKLMEQCEVDAAIQEAAWIMKQNED